MFEGRDDVEAIATAEGPGLARFGFVVDDGRASDGTGGSGAKVEGAIVVFPCRHVGGWGGSTKEIQSEFGLGQEFVQKKVGGGFGEASEDA